jgi:hypothetical protein
MRNAILFLALGMAAIVHFSHQLFPRFTAAAPAYGVFDELDPTGYTPSTNPALWFPESRLENGFQGTSKHIDGVFRTAEAVSGVSLEKPAPRCGVVEPPTHGVRFRGL